MCSAQSLKSHVLVGRRDIISKPWGQIPLSWPQVLGEGGSGSGSMASFPDAAGCVQEIPTAYALAITCAPGLVIAIAKASQDNRDTQ